MVIKAIADLIALLALLAMAGVWDNVRWRIHNNKDRRDLLLDIADDLYDHAKSMTDESASEYVCRAADAVQTAVYLLEDQ